LVHFGKREDVTV